MEIFLALAIGGAFGFVLDRIGATSPNIITGMLSLRNLNLMKTIVLAIGTGSILMLDGQMLGLVEAAHMSVKTAYIGVVIGGLLLGTGWAISGFCPGTGLAAAGAGRRDAIFFILGGLLGAAAYMASFPWIESTDILSGILGGKATLGAVPGTDYPALIPAVRGDILGLVIGVVFVAVAYLLPDSIERKASVVPAE
jgi:hypothetical protein